MKPQDVEELKRELDRRAERDDAFWQAQRQSIQRRLLARSELSSARRSVHRRRPVWALAGLGTAAAGAFVAAALMLIPGSLVSPTDPGASAAHSAAHSVEFDLEIAETTALLRSVETTLASEVAPALSAGDVLLAEMEAEYALLQTQSDP